MSDHLIRTNEILNHDELVDILDWDESEDEDGPLGDLRETHDGEWRREGESYRWYRLDGAYGVFNFGRDHIPASVEVEPGVFVGPLIMETKS